jgi:hypothetical protein
MPRSPLLVAQLDAMHRRPAGDWYYRTWSPGRALAELEGVQVIALDQAHRRISQVYERADVLVIHGVCSADLLPVIARRKAAGQLTVYEINDDVESMQPSNPLAPFFAEPENLRLFRRLAQNCDAVQYSVAELQRLFGALNARSRVWPNQLLEVPSLGELDESRGIRIGWGGSAGHREDMAAIAPALSRFVLEHPGVTLHLMCSDRIWQLFDALPEQRKQRTPTGSIDEYHAFVSRLDIGLAPNLDQGFNRARSDVKFLEYAAHGVVALLQRLTPYLSSVREGETGFLFGDERELVALLGRLVGDRQLRQRVRESAHAYVTTERRERDHVAARLEFYREVGANPTLDKASGLFEELSGMEGATVTGQHLVLSHTAFETALHDGLLLLQRGDQRGAELLRHATRLEPASPLPELLLGAQLGSEADLQASLRKQPKSLQAQLELGLLELRRGEPKQALARFLAAAELAPGYEMPFLFAARAMQALGSERDARELEQLAAGMANAVNVPPRSPANAQ